MAATTGFPIKGNHIWSWRANRETSRFVDYFLQPGMKAMPTFLRETKHLLQIVEELNQNIQDGSLSLDGVGVVSLDVENMYYNMTENLGRGACLEYVNGRVPALKKN